MQEKKEYHYIYDRYEKKSTMIQKQILKIENIPSVIRGKLSNKVYIYVHGKYQNKDYAENFAIFAERKGYQTLSFDLPEHGDRINENTPCNIWHGISELQNIYAYAIKKWKTIALFACSIGAFFALHAYKDFTFEKCLFHSPIIDMNYLIKQMFLWFNVNEDQLQKQQKIQTPVEMLSWEYYCYVKAHPIDKWNTPAQILFGGKENMQNETIMMNFINQFGGKLTVSQNSEHAFLTEKDKRIVNDWLQNSL